jgi:hypothetical protein
MAEPEVEAAWRAEFKRTGETQLRDALNSGIGTDEPKRQAAFRWGRAITAAEPGQLAPGAPAPR